MGITDTLRDLVGPDGYIDDQNILNGLAGDGSLVSGKVPMCVVKPRKAEEVQGIVRLANESGLSLVPYSSGGPHYRGDTVPEAEGAVMVDLTGMKSIVRMDRRNKVALIEPGVTFGELQGAGEREGMRVSMPLLPRKTKSVLGSYLEREPITTPKRHWDSTDPLLCVEVVFGSADLFRTGGAAGPGTLEEQWAAGQAQSNPMGPANSDFMRVVQGSQGTMGIVTWGSVRLEVMPQATKAFVVPAKSLDGLVDFTYRILRPKYPEECLIVNKVDLASILGKADEIEGLVEALPPWSLVYSITGNDYFPEERIAYVETDIRDMAGDVGVKPLETIDGIGAKGIVDLLRKPCEEPYWKLRSKGGCLDIFFMATLDTIPLFLKTMDSEAKKCGYAKELIGVYIQPVQHGRYCHLEFNLMHDPDNVEEAKQATALFESAGKAMLAQGGFFSRPYGPWADMVYRTCPDTVDMLRRLKGIFDPNGVMNPGKLCFAEGAIDK